MVLSETVFELSHITKASKSSLLANKDFEGANTRGSTFRKLQGSKIAYSLINIYTFGVI